MSIQKKITALGLSLLVLGGTMVSTFAYTYVSGTSYQTVTHKDIPSWGGEHYDLNYGSKKTKTSQIGTFKKTKGDAALGNYAELVNSSKSYKSNLVGIPLNYAVLVSEHGCSKGSIYFTCVTSHNFEPSNTCDVTLKFSADDLL
ncbi:hypothetical protein NMU03_00360 [Allocoprobacillus halotolerans]|uniref:Uncharacterized protein n=1 Tax=Allocoprobacillus halotolerans TaxID=2944914 RepID=A0ABY5I1X3_9FIRM|nr:hypothetical protein [Allocoprobacillus halotolerans]UTY39324.1 hypothetical protein NMU03_00360 [Allocoprobacillus halotolerans]